jgi:phosphoenolpyruvate carboxylase
MKFTILLETIPNKIDFYDIWEIRPILEKIDSVNLNEKEVEYFDKLLAKLNSILQKVDIEDKDPLVEDEIKWLKNYINEHILVVA